MEIREILVKNTRDQKVYKVSTDATTLGELKAALDAQGVDYSGMSFTEGISNTTLNDDSSQLPVNVSYKGQVTNNLVFLLTNTKKNISSGALSAERQQVYALIKEHHLEDEIREEYGHNYTLVPTSELWDFVNDYLSDIPEEEEKEEDEEYDDECEDEEEGTYALDGSHGDLEGELNPMEFINNLYSLLKALVKTKTISLPEVKVMAELTQELAARLSELQEKTSIGNIEISQDDLDEMLAKLG